MVIPQTPGVDGSGLVDSSTGQTVYEACSDISQCTMAQANSEFRSQNYEFTHSVQV